MSISASLSSSSRFGLIMNLPFADGSLNKIDKGSANSDMTFDEKYPDKQSNLFDDCATGIKSLLTISISLGK